MLVLLYCFFLLILDLGGLSGSFCFFFSFSYSVLLYLLGDYLFLLGLLHDGLDGLVDSLWVGGLG